MLATNHSYRNNKLAALSKSNNNGNVGLSNSKLKKVRHISHTTVSHDTTASLIITTLLIGLNIIVFGYIAYKLRTWTIPSIVYNTQDKRLLQHGLNVASIAHATDIMQEACKLSPLHDPQFILNSKLQYQETESIIKNLTEKTVLELIKDKFT